MGTAKENGPYHICMCIYMYSAHIYIYRRNGAYYVYIYIYIYTGIVRLKALRGLSVQVRTRTLLWYGHGCSVNRMQLEHGRYYGLSMDAVGNACN